MKPPAAAAAADSLLHAAAAFASYRSFSLASRFATAASHLPPKAFSEAAADACRRLPPFSAIASLLPAIFFADSRWISPFFDAIACRCRHFRLLLRFSLLFAVAAAACCHYWCCHERYIALLFWHIIYIYIISLLPLLDFPSRCHFLLLHSFSLLSFHLFFIAILWLRHFIVSLYYCWYCHYLLLILFDYFASIFFACFSSIDGCFRFRLADFRFSAFVDTSQIAIFIHFHCFSAFATPDYYFRRFHITT